MQGDFILHQRIFGPKRDTRVYHYKIFRGKNLLEAIDQGKNFELLILDVMMEEVDGIALAKGIWERCVKSLASFFIFAFAKRICYDIDKSFCIITIEIGGNQ